MNPTLSAADVKTLPVITSFAPQTPIAEFVDWYNANYDSIQQQLLETGAIVFRGVDIDSLEKFENVFTQLSKNFLNYVDGNSPRTKLSSKVYTSTEYDKNFSITLHNELSYSATYPTKIFFCCILPAESGGETPIADCRKIFEKMNPDLIDEIKRKKVTYVRNLHGGQGFGPTWQHTFETEDRATVEKYCRESKVEFTWKKDGGLKLSQTRDGVIQHPVTNEWVWFNQMDQFHPSHMSPEIYETLMLIYNNNEEELPTYVKFGDNSKVTTDMIKEIRKTVDSLAVLTPWEKGDLLMADNILVCHGRMPYKGDRKVLVSMA